MIISNIYHLNAKLLSTIDLNAMKYMKFGIDGICNCVLLSIINEIQGRAFIDII